MSASASSQHADYDHATSTHTRRHLCTRSMVGVIIGGQLLALLITGTGVFSQLLANRNVNIPTSQSFVNYFMLSLFIIPKYLAWRRKKKELFSLSTHHASDDWGQTSLSTHQSEESADESVNAIHRIHMKIVDGVTPASPQLISPSHPLLPKLLMVAAWKYFILAGCDVEGNFLLVKAYQYTTITSVQLLDCFTIPVVMILSCAFMRTVYNRKHMVGAFICLVGLVLLITSDLIGGRNDDSDAQANDKVLGDILVLIGCVFYAISNIGQEYLVKSFDRFEFLGMLGFWGTIISAIQMSILERDALAQVQFSDPVVCLYLFGFNVCLFLLYYFTPILLLHSSALFMNLSFLTSDFWSILFAVSLFHSRLNLLYFIAFGIIIVGLLLYNLAGVEGDMWELVKELCTTRENGHDLIDGIERPSTPTTHAHTRPATSTNTHSNGGFQSLDQHDQLTTTDLQATDAGTLHGDTQPYDHHHDSQRVHHHDHIHVHRYIDTPAQR